MSTAMFRCADAIGRIVTLKNRTFNHTLSKDQDCIESFGFDHGYP
jgi:hypothetical protein